MSTHRPEEFRERTEAVPPFRIKVVSYRLGESFFCTVDNVDPGAVIARSKGTTRDSAEAQAVAQARERLRFSRQRLENP